MRYPLDSSRLLLAFVLLFSRLVCLHLPSVSVDAVLHSSSSSFVGPLTMPASVAPSGRPVSPHYAPNQVHASEASFAATTAAPTLPSGVSLASSLSAAAEERGRRAGRKGRSRALGFLASSSPFSHSCTTEQAGQLFSGDAKVSALRIQASTSRVGRELASSLRSQASEPEIRQLAASPIFGAAKTFSSSCPSCSSPSRTSCASHPSALLPDVCSFVSSQRRARGVPGDNRGVGAQRQSRLAGAPGQRLRASAGQPGGAKGQARGMKPKGGMHQEPLRGRLEDDEEEEDDYEEEEDEYDDESEDEYDDDEEYDPMTPRGPLDNNNYGEVWLPIQARPRRNRKNRAVRQLVQENLVKPSSLIYPLFIHDEETSVPIPSMPGQKRLSMADLLKEVGEARSYGIKAFMLFPKVGDDLKTVMAEESYNPDGLMPRALMALKEAYPDVLLLADVALDPYSSVGHDGVMDEESGKIVNDLTVHQLCKQAIALARAGADMVCPSDMMDGRVSAIRESLDMEGCTDTNILAYSCKYASSFYGPFRDALDSHMTGGTDKKTYQMDPSNSREAEREAEADVTEGADMLMVKPGLPYLDILAKIREKTKLPMVAYHVSGEYAMLKAAAEKGYINEKEVVLEVLKSFRRAGADAIATYYAKEAAKWMAEDMKGAQKFTEPCY
ncbi:delta-aminolevulinic acid dehydratase, related [Neospora caninum Liverpool]|uniref:Delta-aminolevulinic acid dehydratase n=1 Tax=Neospora caninum (strain Liverpool) TaxID=572307 RepID=F0V9C7_NEOCL|nr:delta-aminolevulinic acid dehydratase, related [Neospora caninum Liverpool]CBZ50352.1 delta-aminolevulinic acid dehydratase, related [Neospora caninum Liverpool]CEL64959.1 TPA: Delta-aminolevulinic acid dehydratase, related [Neospora caninum Liverpool]|eukprot:XP_003880386.1 delta-aminolevulinic acid dehydratase, related [Neospora caninum Liverpool]